MAVKITAHLKINFIENFLLEQDIIKQKGEIH